MDTQVCLRYLSLSPLLQAASRWSPLQSSPLLHKGQRGRVAVVGGSSEYTGAPFFAAMAAERSGSDVVHIFCHPDAAVPIKSYSPTLIVHPLFKNAIWTPSEREAFLNKLRSIHVVVLGPGLGQSEAMIMVANETICFTKREQKFLVADADVFRLPAETFYLLKGHPRCILTPNSIELTYIERLLALSQSSHNVNDPITYTLSNPNQQSESATPDPSETSLAHLLSVVFRENHPARLCRHSTP